MLQTIEVVYGFNDKKVLAALGKVDRASFVPKHLADFAWSDSALPIGHGQTISQPYTVAHLVHLLSLTRADKVLEAGTGSGYQAAVMAQIAGKVYTAEIVPHLARDAKQRLKDLSFGNVFVKEGDALEVWRTKASFNAIVITASITQKTIVKFTSQLVDGGVLVAPVKKGRRDMVTKYRKSENKLQKVKQTGGFRFVDFVHSRKLSSQT
jgi:protein-L-isoaspartate(D-aspartate) O-methyltransferase